MLTHSPDSLPQIVFPMDEDAIPPRPYCSPPPHSEPPPPLLSLSSITPSCVNDGISGSRRSGRIQGIRPQTPTKPSRPVPSPPRRQRESRTMVQVSQKSKRPAVEGAGSHEKSNQAGFAFSAAPECQNKGKDRRSPRKRPNLFAPEDVAEEFEAEHHAYATNSQSDSGVGLADESSSAPKGWVIGPLFQSFKSKMASFTEIVMSPVKLFRSNSPPPPSDCLHATFLKGEIENGKWQEENEEEERILCGTTLEAPKPAAPHLRKLAFGVEPPVPLQQRLSSGPQQGSEGVLVEPPDHASASLEPKVEMVVDKEEEEEGEREQERGRFPQAKPRPRIRTKKVPPLTPLCGGEGAESHPELGEVLARVTPDTSADHKTLSVCYTPAHTHSLHTGDAYKTELGDLVRQSLRSGVNNGVGNEGTPPLERPPTPETHSATGSGRSKRALKADCDAQTLVKRKKDAHAGELKARENAGGASRGLRPPRKDVTPRYAESDEEEEEAAPAKPARKRKAASARVSKKAKAEAPASLSDGVLSPPGGNGEVPESIGTGSGRKAGRPKTKRDACTAMADAEATQTIELTPELHATNACTDKKQRKRKSPGQASAGASPALAAVSTSQTEAGSVKPAARSQPTKRAKKDGKVPVKKSASGRMKQSDGAAPATTKEGPSKQGGAKVSTEPVYFEMTPFEGHRLATPPSNPPLELCGVNGEQQGSSPAAQEPGNHGNASKKVKARRVDKQRRRCRVLHGSVVATAASKDDASLAAGEAGVRRLSRSYSCPEIPALFSPAPVHAAPQQQQQQHTPPAPYGHATQRSPRRARRHTVCSVEVEREIAPLCLRKEVYPSRRSLPYDGFGQHPSPTLPLSPGASLTALASCFLSSPLAFLSRRAERESSANAANAAAASSSSWLLPRFLQRSDASDATLDASSSGNPLESRSERGAEEEDDGGDTSSSSQEFEDAALREEKALSDSEIKVVQKLEQRGKVSSIRIRKTLPKPQNNLTPMGLPKPIRLKKKEFSLEEIYTNKNFSKPPESRLETIFEVPLSRRNGSESWFGQRRVKRFLEFLELGESRRPKKPLAGGGKLASSLSSSSRTRRAGFAKDEASAPVDVDSLLCSKLDQLSLWLIHDQALS